MKGNHTQHCNNKSTHFPIIGNLGIRAKLISLFVLIKVIPLILLAFLVWKQTENLGLELIKHNEYDAKQSAESIAQAGHIALEDSQNALNLRAHASIERMSTDAAQRIASFLYDRDANIKYVASLDQSKALYENFINNTTSRIVKQGEWELSPDEKKWQPKNRKEKNEDITSSLKESSKNFIYRSSVDFTYEKRPLFLEMTFIDLKGQEKIKAITSTQMDAKLKDISKRQNTYAYAETYFSELAKLKEGDIYVSEVIGTYIPSKIMGKYIPENTKKFNVQFAPEQSAFAGEENPLGIRFKGIIRWATPIYNNNEKIGYVTLALDHDHIMELTDHITPEMTRYTELANALKGNFAQIWDYKGRNIVSPRHQLIMGYQPLTGEPQPPLLDNTIYASWQESGQDFIDFSEDQELPIAQSKDTQPSSELMSQGIVGLDCRYLSFVRQCQGWLDLTSKGGSGSFSLIFNGIDRVTSAATIPYFTGQYANSPRGFGFVSIGSTFGELYTSALKNQNTIDALISETKVELQKNLDASNLSIKENLYNIATSIFIYTMLMVTLVIFIAIKIASDFTCRINKIICGSKKFQNGERDFRFSPTNSDELSTLCHSLNQMADIIVNNTQGLTVITDLNTRVIYANDTFLTYIGHKLKYIKGIPYAEVSTFGEFNPLYCLLNEIECPILYYPDTNTYRKGTAHYYNDSEGNHIGFIIQAYDVTELVLLQKKAEEKHILLSTFFSTSPDILWYKNIKGEYLFANDRFLAISGKEMHEIQGQQEQDFMPKDFIADSFAYDEIAKQNAKHVVSQSNIQFIDGHSEIVEAVRATTIDSNGEITGILGSARDVSDRVAVEQKLLKIQNELYIAIDNATKANAVKTNFLSHMSHEIRTPLNAVLGMSTIIIRKLDVPTPSWKEVRKHVEEIEIAGTHLSNLIDDMLEMSKIELGEITIDREDFDFKNVMANVCSRAIQCCKLKNIQFYTNMNKLTNSQFSSDPLRIKQVINTLLSTAIKYSPKLGTISFDIFTIEYENHATHFQFTIKSTSTEITPEVITSLFAAFDCGQADEAKDFDVKSMDLFISQSIVNLLGGKIEISRNTAEETIFTFNIWLDDASTPTICKKELDTSILKGKHILIVDDVEINRIIVLEMLDDMCLEVDEAVDGKDGLDKFIASAENYYDLILMDIQMPILDGYQCTSAIRALDRPDAKSIPIVALSANSFKDDIQKALDSGMNEHLAKPVNYVTLLATLVKHIM